jgi:hypothetical protein
MSNNLKQALNGSAGKSVSDVSPDQLEDLAVALQAHAKKLRAGSVTEKEHHKLVATFAAVENALYTPLDDIYCHFRKISEIVAVGLLLRWYVFRHIPPDGTVSYDELASKVEAEPNIIRERLQ